MVFSYDCLTDWALLIIKKIIYLENRLSVCFLLFCVLRVQLSERNLQTNRSVVVGILRQNKTNEDTLEWKIEYLPLFCVVSTYRGFDKNIIIHTLKEVSNKLLTINGSKNSKHIYNLFLCTSEFWGLNNHKNRTEDKSRTFKANAFFLKIQCSWNEYNKTF